MFLAGHGSIALIVSSRSVSATGSFPQANLGARKTVVPLTSRRTLRHFIVALKEATFECLAESLRVERFCPTFDEAYAHVREIMSRAPR